MKRKEEKRRKLHEGLLKMLYPSPSSPSHQRESSEEPENTHSEGLDLDLVPDEYEKERSSSSASDQEGGCEPQKLTRAQRKRIRRKKIKEAASRCQKIIGPLLPNASEKGTDMAAEIVDEHPPGVRQNAQTPEAAWPTKQNKVKQRRMAKKLGSESSTFSVMANSDTGPGPFNNASAKES